MTQNLTSPYSCAEGRWCLKDWSGVKLEWVRPRKALQVCDLDSEIETLVLRTLVSFMREKNPISSNFFRQFWHVRKSFVERLTEKKYVFFLSVYITTLTPLSDGEWSHGTVEIFVKDSSWIFPLQRTWIYAMTHSTRLWIVAFVVLIWRLMSCSHPGKHTDLFGLFPGRLLPPSVSLILRKPLFAARVSQAERRCSCDSWGGGCVYRGNAVTIHCTSCWLFVYQINCRKKHIHSWSRQDNHWTYLQRSSYRKQHAS